MIFVSDVWLSERRRRRRRRRKSKRRKKEEIKIKSEKDVE